MKVRWSAQAQKDLVRIYAYLKAEAPHVAVKVLIRISEAGESLDETPDRGRLISSSLRELTTARPYVIRYRVKAGEVQILRVRHGARRPLK